MRNNMSWARTYCQRSSSRQGGAKDQEKKKRSEGPVRQISRYELSENVIICSYFDYFECSTLESISFNFFKLSPFPGKKKWTTENHLLHMYYAE